MMNSRCFSFTTCFILCGLMQYNCMAKGVAVCAVNDGTASCFGLYGPPVTSSCLSTPCVLGVCPLPWQSTPILGNYNIQKAMGRPAEEGETPTLHSVRYLDCYNGTPCVGCRVDPIDGWSYCNMNLFGAGFKWQLPYLVDLDVQCVGFAP
jgi:hypothetical protein